MFTLAVVLAASCVRVLRLAVWRVAVGLAMVLSGAPGSDLRVLQQLMACACCTDCMPGVVLRAAVAVAACVEVRANIGVCSAGRGTRAAQQAERATQTRQRKIQCVRSEGERNTAGVSVNEGVCCCVLCAVPLLCIFLLNLHANE